MAAPLGLGNILHALINESKELNALDTIARELCIRDEQEDRHLQEIHDTLLVDMNSTGANRLTSVVDVSIQNKRTQRTLELRAMRKELDYLTPSTTWTRFQNHVNEVEELEIKCADAKEAAKTSVNREEYWSSLRSITSWLDLRLPKEGMVPEDSQGAALNHLDLHYRLIVSNINAAKDHAFSFYVNNQDELRRYHQARFTAIQNIFYMLFKKRYVPFIEVCVPSPQAHIGQPTDIEYPFSTPKLL
ncbi:hypothetical protein FRB91_005943 [Serendipita sp. 411]|nr:hypothetical protein FRC19_004275 [Serendipita sp. 401]KAG8840557.1 hypothetical protein FRB91_005943 [Serendipita sp. 411]KAG9053486.1 hypothetical protein FS842_008117 [Serendipita sp. 407]